MNTQYPILRNKAKYEGVVFICDIRKIRGNPRFRQHKRVGSAGFVNPAGAVWGWNGLEEGCLIYGVIM